MTLSLLARDPGSGALGVATQSHFFGAGATVPWAQAGVGVVATQAIAERSYGPRILAALRRGVSASRALAPLLEADPARELRQVACLDAVGGVGIHTGTRCLPAAGAATEGCAAAVGNMLERPAVLDAMLQGFHRAPGDLAHRLVAGLRGGEQAGGDIRGRQSAALLVVSGERGDAPWEGVIHDLRVDDHPDPVGELARLVDLADAFRHLSQVVFDPDGPVFGESVSDDEFAAAAQSLAQADQVLGSNPEAAWWSAVLHARRGRFADARRLLAGAARRNPRLPRLVAGLVEAGIVTAEQAARWSGRR
ncbi:DUF1028 domain-containing protein [Mycobacterium botniense]|uniref:DUF1028 domain-containing protein n=1 Tax=Mycobacterium botniense TaxID=84962 RepID=A0A7I9XV12_9MYCO|nr:DUF1028 domain-containing protein [Mycobacterium botniense]GFG73197.1 hypothetical protein MBOT_05620 [Mycobacterium botniense]